MAKTIEELKQMSTSALMDLFKTLDAPSIKEMDGVFSAGLLKQKSPIFTIMAKSTFENPLWPGIWQSKAFRPVSESEGRGYNGFRYLGKDLQRFAMLTRIANSRYDNKPIYQLDYREYDSLCGLINMVDEVRKLSENTYLGFGTWGFTAGQRMIPMPFYLKKSTEKYKGDIGKRVTKK